MSLRSFDDTLALVAGVEGWMTDGQARRLFEAASQVASEGRIVEIGSFRGRSTIVLASAARDGVEVVAIDPHAGNDRGPQELEGFAKEAESDFETFHRNLSAAGVEARVRHVRRPSDQAHDAIDGRIDLLYIDGAHRYRPARSDVRRWGERVADGGTLLIHDSFSSIGVTLALGRELFLSRRFRYVGRSRSLAEYRADLGSGRRTRLLNLWRQVYQLPWFVGNVALKALIALRLSWMVRLVTGRRPEWPY
ncbi:MAG: class I SAM-dependent methyltransferase [Ilumatobacteraceae bacterium]